MSSKYNILTGGYFYNVAPIDIRSKEIKTRKEKKNHFYRFRLWAMLIIIKYRSLRSPLSALKSDF